MDYKEKLKLAKEALDSGSYDRDTIEYIFPELKESEDERIRKALIEFVKFNEKNGYVSFNDVQTVSMTAWLEKQGEQTPTQETEPFEAEHGKYYYCIKDYFCGGELTQR